jgi:hypothetical protein
VHAAPRRAADVKIHRTSDPTSLKHALSDGVPLGADRAVSAERPLAIARAVRCTATVARRALAGRMRNAATDQFVSARHVRRSARAPASRHVLANGAAARVSSALGKSKLKTRMRSACHSIIHSQAAVIIPLDTCCCKTDWRSFRLHPLRPLWLPLSVPNSRLVWNHE